VARVDSAWTFKKGSGGWTVAEQIRLSPAPKLGGWAGKQLRFLSVTRGQSVLTDVEQGSLAVNRRVSGLPSMQRMWFSRLGYSLGHTKPRGSAGIPELFFIGPEARLWSQQRLPAAVAEATAGTNEWYVACRNGRVYAYGFDGSPLWNELIPHARRDNATNAYWGLPIFHPRLRLAADGPVLAIATEQEFHRYESSGERLFSDTLPPVERIDTRIECSDLPTREDRLSRLGIRQSAPVERVQTGYLRLALDTLMNAGWLQQVGVYDIEDAEAIHASTRNDIAIQFGFPPVEPGISVIRASWNLIAIGTQNGLVHVFDWNGSLQRTFHVGETAVSDLLVTPTAVKAAYCAGRLTLFDKGRITASTELPENAAELSHCGSGVVVWKSKSVWVVEPAGRVQLAAETDRPIRGVWGHSSGFYVLAGELSSLQVRPAEVQRGRRP
jgi:hypothetical protein